MKKIFIVLCLSLIFFSCNSRKNETNEQNQANESKNIENSEETYTDYEGIACFDLVAINFNTPGEGIYPNGALYLIFKNYETDFGGHLYKILDYSMPIYNIEKLSDGIVTQGDLFKVHTFLPGGGTKYKFTFEDGKLLKYVMDMPEGDFEYIPEYSLDETYEFENVSKVKLEEVSVIE